MTVAGLRRELTDALFPMRCHGCQRLYTRFRRPTVALTAGRVAAEFDAWASEYFCPACARAQWTASPLCTRCGLPYVSRQGVDHPCSHCRDNSRFFDEARSAGTYDHGLRTLVQDLKYRGREDLAAPLGRLLWATLVAHWPPDDFDWILPVPLHWRRLLRRGFNQSEVLLRCWPQAARASGLDFNPRKIRRRRLIRRRATASQTGLGRRRRKANLRKAFGLRRADGVRGRRILVVDDVFTTGATADACGRVLKRAGAASVKVLTLARSV